MKQYTLISYFCLLSFFVLPAQDLDIISSSGGFSENTEVSLSWTIGEPIVESFEGDDYSLSHGFQQGNLTVETLIEEELVNNFLWIYPNPVKDRLTIECSNDHEDFQLIDIQGKVVWSMKGNKKKMEVDFSDLPPGSYFLRTSKLKTHKIIKQ
ncbi:MAG: T9SS type A sorting domain-containing protein [bacterium]